MRAFIGIEIPEIIREKYANICKPLRKNSIIRFVSGEKMHITLAFFPDLPANKVDDVMDVVKNIGLKPFTINCDNIGLFKNKGIPSTIFVKILSEDLKAYTKILHENIMQLNIPFDNRRPFTPHITTARINEMLDEEAFMKDYRFIVKRFEKSDFQVNKINLYSSDMINHKVIASYNFNEEDSILG